MSLSETAISSPEQPNTTTNRDEIKITTGFVKISPDTELYYELRSTQVLQETSKVIMIMGAFATLKHFDKQAQFIVKHFAHSSTPMEVLTYDHRGIGKSLTTSKVRQTSRMLADDALALIDKVWAANEPVHIYGASLGGMVAQELALLLIQSNRLRSLYLAVTSRGSFIRPMAILGPSTWSLLMPFLIKKDHERMIRDVLLPATFSPSALKVSGEQYATLWINEYDQWWAFGNQDACACQCSVTASHYLSNDKGRLIRDAGIPITVQISLKDALMSSKKQEELAKLLNAKTVVFDQGHLGDDDVQKELFQACIQHLEESN
ncbi:unnamed protein product [Rotaria sordida]|uniref:AB hydrolase-1 domain-containing protein n=1 Tax=Rotaria sordida TaxID=392033 RepID=A0A818YYJ0_9BILA|nr:unnamed protein product [Rotaria sordida]CAF1087579.1 unnamed protein product [Rotaria sordida]CAF3711657.1 unnamed protein product [Rotaria sordida]CAF3761176.1 unnamed protein product [Rotaria sordida]